MLRLGNQIRLSSKEKRTLTTMTGVQPININTVEALNNYIDFHKRVLSENTPEEKLLAHLLELEKINP